MGLPGSGCNYVTLYLREIDIDIMQVTEKEGSSGQSRMMQRVGGVAVHEGESSASECLRIRYDDFVEDVGHSDAHTGGLPQQNVFLQARGGGHVNDRGRKTSLRF